MDCVALLRAIRDLQAEIAEWRTKNSQSNPGAMMELRDNKKKLEKYMAAYEKLKAAEEAKDKASK
jgi:hypothetical protein